MSEHTKSGTTSPKRRKAIYAALAVIVIAVIAWPAYRYLTHHSNNKVEMPILAPQQPVEGKIEAPPSTQQTPASSGEEAPPSVEPVEPPPPIEEEKAPVNEKPKTSSHSASSGTHSNGGGMRPAPSNGSNAASAAQPRSSTPSPSSSSTTRNTIPLPLAQPDGSSMGYQVQLGLFSNLDNAVQLVKQLRDKGIKVHTETRVQVGPFKSRAEAEATIAHLRELGFFPLLAPAGTK